MTFAIIKTGGKQYKVKEGDILLVERLKNKKEIIFDSVLLLNKDDKVLVGRPFIKGAQIKAEVLEEIRGKKVKVVKFKRKVRYHKKSGHRQIYSKIKILKIEN